MLLTTIVESPVPRNSNTVLEIVIEDLADENALLRERIASLEADVGTYRELAIATLDALAHVTQQHQQLRNDYQEQSDAYRWLCQETLLRAGADDDEAV